MKTNDRASRGLSEISKSILGDVLTPDNANEEISLDAILAEFGGEKKEAVPAAPVSQPHSVKPEPALSDLPEPVKPPKNTPAPVITPEIKSVRPVSQPPQVISFKTSEPERKPSVPVREREPSSRPLSPPAPVLSSDEVSVEPYKEDGPVIDLGAFDRIYEKKQKKIKLLKEQIISNEKAKINAEVKRLRARKIGSLKPATLKTAPIPIPLAAKLTLDANRIKASSQSQTVINPKSISLPEEPAEDKKPKKPPINPYTMMKKVGKLKNSLNIRTWFAFIFTIPLIYLAAGHDLSLPVPEILDFAKNPFMFTVISMGLLFTVIIIGYDVYFGGCYDLLTLRPSCDSLVFCSSLASLGHCVYSIFDSSALKDAAGDPAFAPVCALPALAITFSLLGDRIRYKSYYRSLRNSYRLTHSKVLSVLPEKYDGDIIYAAANSDNLQGFFKSMRENDMVASSMLWLSPIIILASLGLAFYANSMGPTRAPFFWCWSVTAAFAPALGYFLGSALPLSIVSKRMYKNGVLFGGGKGISRLGGRSFVLLNDHDIFPGEAISINGFKLVNRDGKEFAISMTSSLLDAAGTSLAKPFLRLASDNYAPIRPVSDLNISDSGGISGYIDGHNVMVGNGSYIQRCGIKIPPDIKLRTAVFCAVDTELLIIFAVRYQVMPRNDYSMSLLEDNGYFPIIASRDFNVTASFIQNRFGIPSSELVYPSADLRTSMSDPSLTLDAGGILISRGCCGESIAESLVACHRYRTVAKLALVFSMFSSIIGIGLGALMAYNGWSAAAAPVNMLLYYSLWLLPVILFSGWVNRF